MPLYEYRCDACGQRFEVIQKFSDPPPDACRLCGKGPVERQQASPAIQFKGTGWYITDYARKGQSEKTSTDSGSSKSEGAATEGKSDAGTSDSAKSDAGKSDSGKSGTGKTDSAKSDTAKSGSSKSEASAAKKD